MTTRTCGLSGATVSRAPERTPFSILPSERTIACPLHCTHLPPECIRPVPPQDWQTKTALFSESRAEPLLTREGIPLTRSPFSRTTTCPLHCTQVPPAIRPVPPHDGHTFTASCARSAPRQTHVNITKPHAFMFLLVIPSFLSTLAGVYSTHRLCVQHKRNEREKILPADYGSLSRPFMT